MTMMRSMARLAGVAGLCLLGFSARAEVPPNGPAYMDAAFSAVISLTQGRAKPTVPRLADPVEGKVLDDIWNVQPILGAAPYNGNDIPALLGILQKQAQIVGLYTLFTPTAGAKPDPARNISEYQDELTRTHEFQLKVVVAALQAMNSFGAHLTAEEKTAERFQGLRQMRNGLKEVVTAAANALKNPGLRPDNQLRLARAFSENAAGLAAGFAPPIRTEMVSTVQAAGASLKGEAQKAVADFVKTVGAEPCNGLCRLD